MPDLSLFRFRMSNLSRKWLFQGAGIIIAGALLYLALRGVDINRVGTDMANGAYIWVFPLFIVTILSHVIRAWRWTLLLNVLPENVGDTGAVPVFTAFKSLMIGYMSNYVAPRLGELVRTGHMAARTGYPFSSIFGTVVAERMLDVVSLGIGLLSLPFLLGPALNRVRAQLIEDGSDYSGIINIALIVSVVLVLLILLAFFLFRKWNQKKGNESRFSGWIESFRAGIVSITKTQKTFQLVVSTVLMWTCYGLMGYWPFYVFGMVSQYDLGFADGWSVMLLGAIGVLIPSPGGIGSYHYIAITALVTIWGVTQATAVSYAVFTHGGQLILYASLGFTVLVLDGTSWKELTMARKKSSE